MKNPSNVESIDTGTRPEDRPPTRVYDNVADLVADPDNPTPMIRLSRRFTGLDAFELYVKLERNNPFGSIKDRTALYLLNGLDIREGQILAEPTAGNTGIALAALANARGTPIELALPDGTPEEKKALLRFLGAGLLEVEDDLCPLFPTEGPRGGVKSLVESAAYDGKYVSPNQYENELNVEAHYRTTGPEIWNQTGGRVEWFFAAFGTCGTITGVGTVLKERKPDAKIVAVEPEDSPVLSGGDPGPHKIQGIGAGFVPGVLNRGLIDEVLTPDSSRFWPAADYRPGQEPPSWDKQILRNHLETLDWNKTAPGPDLPGEIQPTVLWEGTL